MIDDLKADKAKMQEWISKDKNLLEDHSKKRDVAEKLRVRRRQS